MTAIDMVIEPRDRPVGTGSVRRVLPWRERRMVGPFIFADLIGPDHLAPGSGVDIDAHPHIGLSTLTYLFEGRMVHRDSTGAVQTIEPGAVNWMTAGAGVTHTERSHPEDRGVPAVLHGIQLWVALPSADEECTPSFEHHPAASAPVIELPSATVRIVAGTGWGTTAPVAVSSPLMLAQLDLDDGAAVALDADHPERAVLLVDGHATVDGTPLGPGQLAVITPGSRPVLHGPGRVVVLGGEPVGPRRIWWNFVHSDPERIEEAKAAWAAQRFPLVPDDHEPWVPAPA